MKVFLDYTQDELDRAYDQRVWAPNAAEVIARYATASAEVRRRVSRRADVRYGPTEDETLDVFPEASGSAPVLVFVHGGAWRGGHKDDYSFPAETLVGAGVGYVALNFASTPAARLPEMADQVRRAIAWVYRNASRFGGDASRLYLGGQSSGGHLAAVAMTTDWPGQFELPADMIKGGLLVSGMYELAPVRLSKRSAYVAFDDRTVEELSPIRHLDRLRAPVVVAYGTCETPEFQRQTREFAAAVAAAGKPVRLLVGEHYNHFELPESLANPYGLLGRAVLELMGLR